MRSLRLLAALALAAAATLTVTAAGAAPGDGTLTVTLVDEHGAPMPGGIYLITAGADYPSSTTAVSTLTTDLPPGAYAVLAITPWGGMQCVGIDPCDYYSVFTGAVDPDGSLVVEAGQTRTVTIDGEVPATVSGPGRIGRPITLDWSAGMADLIDYLGAVGGGAFTPTVSWLRNGEPIAGANDDAYQPVGADVGKRLSVRVEYTGIALSQFQTISGAPVTPRTTNAVQVSKVPTKTFAILSNPQVRAGNHGKVRVEVTAKNQVVTGKVTVTLGDWSQTRPLRNGTARVLLPVLKPGRYAVGARYLGSTVYSPSTGDDRTLTVTR